MVDLIGTLAKSGTAELRQQLREAKNAQNEAASEELIGQFGIGFYSSFMVADKVELLTRKAGESEATKWESSGEGTYTIESVENAPQGTSVTLHLKPEDTEDELHDYTSEFKIKSLVKKYSDFIAWPIRMEVERRTPATEEGGEETVTREVETLNSMKALWARPKDEVSEEEYKEFYKHIAHAWDDPLEVIAMKAEGTFEYQALLFIPSHAPFDLFNRDAHTGIQLYVKRVFIMGDCDQLMPEYLRFVKGVVDAQDMSLNVSREILQQDRQIKAIRRRLTKKVLSTIKELQSERPDDYRTFWTQFGRVVKEGLLSDFDNQETLLQLCSFASTHSEEEATTLAQYVERMKEGQTQIFYATGETRQQILKSPHLEAFKAKGYEVLLLTDPVDEVWVGTVTEFDGKPLQSIAKGEVDLSAEGEESQAEREEQQKEFADLLAWLKDTLSDHVKEVRLSNRLTDSPACLITDASASHRRWPGSTAPPGRTFRWASEYWNSIPSTHWSPACAKLTRTAPTIRPSPRPRNCFTAQRFWLRAAPSTTRPGSPRYWPTGWPAPCSPGRRAKSANSGIEKRRAGILKSHGRVPRDRPARAGGRDAEFRQRRGRTRLVRPLGRRQHRAGLADGGQRRRAVGVLR